MFLRSKSIISSTLPVLAATAGCTGLGMTLFSLGIGIAADATGWQRDAVRPMNAGGVLDEVAELSVRSQPGDRLVSRADRDESLLILQQQPNAYRVFSPPPVRLQRPLNRPDLLPGNSGFQGQLLVKLDGFFNLTSPAKKVSESNMGFKGL